MDKINLAIVDDDLLVLELIRKLFESDERFNVVYSTGDGEQFLNYLNEASNRPDLVLLDLKMKGLSGIAITEYIKKEKLDIQVIILSSHYQRSHIGYIFKVGASAFLPKGVSPLELKEIVCKVAHQGYYFDDEQMNHMREQVNVKSPVHINEDELLSEREIEVIKLICEQFTAKEIAEKLFITQRTVEGHKNNIFAKTGAKNIAGLVIYAVQNKLIDESSFSFF